MNMDLGQLIHKAVFAALVMGAVSAMPGAGRADCDVRENGIPEDVAFAIDAFGARKALARAGIGVGGSYTGEGFGNWGGVDDGSEYDGVLELHMDADMKKLGLWKGLCFHANGYQIHGNSITAANIGSFAPVSSVEATRATRLFEFWFEQTLYNKVKIRVGQMATDSEFVLSTGGSNFLDATWGWPTIAAADLPNGGPAYPLSAPGIRLAIDPNDRFGVMVALFNGDPVGPDCTLDDPQKCNDNGLDFRIKDPPLLMAEGHYTYNKGGREGTIKLGVWNHFGDFENQRFDDTGGLLGVTSGTPRVLEGNYGLYGIIDQLIWRMPGGEEGEDPKGVGVFARLIGAPDDRNLVDFYAEAGITFSGMIPNRPNDVLAIGYAYTGISDRASAFDRDSGLTIIRDHEAVIEICYTYEIKSGWRLQPHLHYIFRPGGGVPDDTGFEEVDDAVVVGARTALSF